MLNEGVARRIVSAPFGDYADPSLKGLVSRRFVEIGMPLRTVADVRLRR